MFLLPKTKKRQMYVDILPDPVACDNKAVIRFYRDTDEDSEAFLKKLNDELDKIKRIYGHRRRCCRSI